MSIVIVDYDVGNLRSVQKGLEKAGASAKISRDKEDISSATALVLPGVGAFAECMKNLGLYDLLDPVRDFISSGRPFLGICVGYQLLFEESEEFGHCKGIGALKGKCVKFDSNGASGFKIPHMGWNKVDFVKPGRLFKGVPDGSDFYFVHSFYPVPEEEITISTTNYGVDFASSVEKGNIFATQFHPEKSQRAGLKVLENFSKLSG
ncbi:Imidazole glycerol phosphate synthase amidotransferase subunit [hydrothermal vent metagenome]|uniref:Imidazole glycerol phosphate synthase amidotransferase subunit n=1 Tax=hydrothermal vent metagenome TaxID=652676 RepID=A0A3B1C9N8_9ZZZZ